MSKSISHHINIINSSDSDGSNPSSHFTETQSKVIEKIQHRKFNDTVCIVMYYLSLTKDLESTSSKMSLSMQK